jgi:hypothetical protein
MNLFFLNKLELSIMKSEQNISPKKFFYHYNKNKK